MSLKDTLGQDMKTAMKAKDQAALRALRAIKSAILLAETAEGREAGSPLSEEEELKLLTKQAKQRRDSIEQFKSNNREDLAQTEAEELAIIEKYLPNQVSEAELTEALKSIVEETGASSMKDMGKVMGVATKKFAGRADGKMISTIVRGLLG
ncbi:MAG: GatB/YqeY domain-containing protein [Bacteroidota bacterium]